MQTKLVEERQLASQHQLALQAQASEAQAHIKVCVIRIHPVCSFTSNHSPLCVEESVCYCA